MTHTALYYPHWGIGSPLFMFEALLYWDRLTCIVPYDEFSPGAYWGKELGSEAELFHESFVTGIAPDDEVKARVHDRLVGLLDTSPPSWCRAEDLAPSEAAIMATRKVSPGTMRVLEERGWMLAGDDGYARISAAASGLVLGALAEEMASDTMPPVTDETTTFKATCNGLLRELQSRQGVELAETDTGFPLEPIGPYEESELGIALAKITKLGIDEGGIGPKALKCLYRLRQDSGFNEQRQRFRMRVDEYVAELRERPPLEHQAIHDHWAMELASDRQGLKKDLRAAGIRGVTEKDGLIATGLAATAGAGAFAAFAAAGPAVLVIGLGLAGVGIAERVRERRSEARERHWTSWLAAASSRSRSVF